MFCLYCEMDVTLNKKVCSNYPGSLRDYTELVKNTFKTRLLAYFTASTVEHLDVTTKSDAEKRFEFSRQLRDASIALNWYIGEGHKEAVSLTEQSEMEFELTEKLTEQVALKASELNMQQVIVRKKDLELKDLGRCRYVVNNILGLKEKTMEEFLFLMEEMAEDCMAMLEHREKKIIPMGGVTLDYTGDDDNCCESEGLKKEIEKIKIAMVQEQENLEAMKAEALCAVKEVMDSYITDRNIINIQIQLEDFYRNCIRDDTQDVPMLEMLRAVDSFTRKLIGEASSLSGEKLKALERRFEREEQHLLAEAVAAEKAYKQVSELARAMGTKTISTRRKIRRSKPPVEHHQKVKKSYNMTALQREYLELFTDVRLDSVVSTDLKAILSDLEKLKSYSGRQELLPSNLTDDFNVML